MKKIILFFIVGVLISIHSYSQITPPYSNNFDNYIDTVGWSHYALSGSDDWQIGVPFANLLNTSFSQQKVWGTNLGGAFTQNSIMCLETPFFDFSDTSKSYNFGFGHEINSYSYHGGNIEYSVDSGQTWILLNGSASQNNQWYNNPSCSGLNGEPSWSYNYYNTYKFSYHSLDTLSGQSSVKFRFKFGGTSNPQEGWIIDNFSISESGPNVIGIPNDTITLTRDCPNYDVNLTLVYSGIIKPIFTNTTKYFWSNDAVFDLGDTLIGSKSQSVSSTIPWNKTFSNPQNLTIGLYYIFYIMDSDSNLTESNEIDNLGMAVIKVDTIYDVPLISHFDDTINLWGNVGIKWKLGQGNLHNLEGTHSGGFSILNFSGFNDYIESPHINASTDDSTVISFWYRTKVNLFHIWYMPIQYTIGCNTIYTDISDVPKMRDNTWDFFNVYLPIEADTTGDIKVRIWNWNNANNVIIDDIYIGKAKPDLTIERDKKNRYTSNSSSSDTLKYYFNNGGFVGSGTSTSTFYWSNDSILDISDVLLGNKSEPVIADTSREWRTFQYTKPTLANGVYYIIYVIDKNNVIDEMREYNNEGYFKIYQEDSNPIPYFNDFETQVTGWRHNSSLGNDEWVWGTPTGTVLNSAFSGTKVWVTNDTGLISNMNRMHLYTPIFDLSSSSNPVLEFDMRDYNTATGSYIPGIEIGHNMSYSVDGGATWQVLDTTNNSYNRWYYGMDYNEGGGQDGNVGFPYTTDLMFDLTEPVFANTYQYNSRDADRNTRYILDLSFLAGNSNIQFRFNLANTFSSQNFAVEGFMLDNFSIKEAFIDIVVPHKKSLMVSSLSQKIKFFMKIKNEGNYISNSSLCLFYLSNDTIIDGNDYSLGGEVIPSIRPDMNYYINKIYTAPSNLSNYKYLIYKLDANNSNIENNEINNIGYWPLALDSISTYPYFENFDNTVVNGWNHYVIDYWGNHTQNQWRVRNKIAPGEYLYQTDIKSNQLFTDRINNVSLQVPTIYIESPAFNFSEQTNISLSFDLMCIGKSSVQNQDGGNMQFSTDGGNSWTILDVQYGAATNWYTNTSLNNLNNEPGWAKYPAGYGIAILDSTSFDLSFLSGDSNVLFRYKYRSNFVPYGGGTVGGIRIDNFKITTAQLTTLSPINICQTDSALIFNTYQNIAGNYYDTLTNVNNMDSIILQTLTVNYIDTSVSLNNNILTSNENGSSYQWLDCNNGNSIINGATNQSFIPSLNGSYAVEITKNGCTDTSNCIQVIGIGINETDLTSIIKFYPNPNIGQFTIEKSVSLNKRIDIKLFDVTSKLIIEKVIPINKQKIDIDIRNYSKGLYYLQLIIDEEQFIKQIIKN